MEILIPRMCTRLNESFELTVLYEVGKFSSVNSLLLYIFVGKFLLSLLLHAKGKFLLKGLMSYR